MGEKTPACNPVSGPRHAASRVPALPADPPQTPGRPPDLVLVETVGNEVHPMGAARPASHDPEQPHPAAAPQPMPGDRLIGIFRTGRKVPAGIADEARQRQLVEPDEACAQQPCRRLRPGPGEIARASSSIGRSGHCCGSPMLCVPPRPGGDKPPLLSPIRSVDRPIHSRARSCFGRDTLSPIPDQRNAARNPDRSSISVRRLPQQPRDSG